MQDILTLDMSGITKQIAAMGGAIEQMPFAISKALNTAAFNARTVLVQSTWPTHVQVRNSRFINAALKVDPSRKHDLTVSITDARMNGRGNLALHAKGGVKQSRGRVAVPQAFIKRGAHGVSSKQRPMTLVNSFKRGGVILQRIGKGSTAHLRIAYALTSRAYIKKDVPFVDDFNTAMRNDLVANIPAAMMKAMGSARK